MSRIIPYRVGQLGQLRVQLGHEPTEIFLLSTGAAEVAAARMVLVCEVEACGFDATLGERARARAALAVSIRTTHSRVALLRGVAGGVPCPLGGTTIVRLLKLRGILRSWSRPCESVYAPALHRW